MGSHGRGLRWWLLGALVAVLGIAAFGAWLHATGGGPLQIDLVWGEAVRADRGSPVFVIALGFAAIGSTLGVTVCATIAATGLLLLRRNRDAIAVALAVLMGVAASEIVKLLVARPRPPDALLQAPGFSYPSGHSMGAAALTVSLVMVVCATDFGSRRASHRAVCWAVLGAAAWTILMMWSRTALGVHWLTDTVAGALLGTSAAIVAHALCRPRSVVSRR